VTANGRSELSRGASLRRFLIEEDEALLFFDRERLQ